MTHIFDRPTFYTPERFVLTLFYAEIKGEFLLDKDGSITDVGKAMRRGRYSERRK